ncbi:hypothetical protein [Pseudonocardia adelaidensis]|uniref:hypothetical protein n=1 Tax=Pseudonocardia adelaidensis TaxID=648754 RepID=UPI0031F00BDA
MSQALGRTRPRVANLNGVAGRHASTLRPADGPAAPIKVQQVLEVVGLFLAPATMVTAVLYWFGFELTVGRVGWFGLTTGVLGFSTTDYLIRGTEAGVVPLVVLFFAVLVGVAAHGGLARLAARRYDTRWCRPALAITLVVGGLLSAAGFAGAFIPLSFPADGYLTPPALLATAPLFTVHVGHLLLGDVDRRYFRAAAIAAIGLAVLGVFWATSLYAEALGRGRGQQLANDLGSLPAVTVYSERSLALHTVPSKPLAASESGRYTRQYSGLRLLLFSGGKYFLLPDTWTQDGGTVVILADTAELRVEIGPGG